MNKKTINGVLVIQFDEKDKRQINSFNFEARLFKLFQKNTKIIFNCAQVKTDWPLNKLAESIDQARHNCDEPLASVFINVKPEVEDNFPLIFNQAKSLVAAVNLLKKKKEEKK